MKRPHAPIIGLPTLLLALSLGASAQAQPGVARYRVTFDAAWSQQTHPTNFPANAHWSGLIGGTHHDGIRFWEVGELASPGIKTMAETGGKSPLSNEINAAIDAAGAFSLISGGGIASSPGSVSTNFFASFTHPEVTICSMIAPSPDWFIGVSSLSLRENGQWLDDVVVDLYPYDAGTDSGTNFTSPNQPTNPPEPIYQITGFPFQNTPPLGTFTFELLNTTIYDRAGWVAEIPTTFVHDVTGTVTVIDDRTLLVENFTYDGTAPAVYFYLGATNSQQSFENGIPIGPELNRAYNDESLFLQLPIGQSLDGWGAISVWCEEFSVNFSSASIVAPLAGDLNCDGALDFGDINPFVQALTDPAAWRDTYRECPVVNGDTNFDRKVDFADINGFVDLLTMQ